MKISEPLKSNVECVEIVESDRFSWRKRLFFVSNSSTISPKNEVESLFSEEAASTFSTLSTNLNDVDVENINKELALHTNALRCIPHFPHVPRFKNQTWRISALSNFHSVGKRPFVLRRCRCC